MSANPYASSSPAPAPETVKEPKTNPYASAKSDTPEEPEVKQDDSFIGGMKRGLEERELGVGQTMLNMGLGHILPQYVDGKIVFGMDPAQIQGTKEDMAKEQERLEKEGKGTGVEGTVSELAGDPTTYVGGPAFKGLKGAFNLMAKGGFQSALSAFTAPTTDPNKTLGDRAVDTSIAAPIGAATGGAIGKAGEKLLGKNMPASVNMTKPSEVYKLARKMGLSFTGKETPQQIYDAVQKAVKGKTDMLADSVAHGASKSNVWEVGTNIATSKVYAEALAKNAQLYKAASDLGAKETAPVEGLTDALKAQIDEMEKEAPYQAANPKFGTTINMLKKMYEHLTNGGDEALKEDPWSRIQRLLSEEGGRKTSFLSETRAVDVEGQPLKVFHGTPKTFDKFKPDENGVVSKGIWFTRDPNVADFYASKQSLNEERGLGANIRPVYLDIKNPASSFYEYQINPKYDGYIGDGDYVVRDPKQVYSAFDEKVSNQESKMYKQHMSVTGNQLVEMDQALNENFGRTGGKGSSGRALSELQGKVQGAIQAMSPDFSNAYQAAKNDFRQNIVQNFRENPTLNKYWKEDDYHALQALQKGVALSPDLKSRVNGLLDKISSFNDLSEMKQHLDPQTYDRVRAAKFVQLMNKAGLDSSKLADENNYAMLEKALGDNPANLAVLNSIKTFSEEMTRRGLQKDMTPVQLEQSDKFMDRAFRTVFSFLTGHKVYGFRHAFEAITGDNSKGIQTRLSGFAKDVAKGTPKPVYKPGALPNVITKGAATEEGRSVGDVAGSSEGQAPDGDEHTDGDAVR